MTPAQLHAARSAITCAGWKYVPGMLVQGSRGNVTCSDLCWYNDMRVNTGNEFWLWNGLSDNNEWIPDLTDHATLGCIIGLARKAWGAPTLYARPTQSGYIIMLGSGKGMTKIAEGDTEGEALVAALRLAP